MTNVYGNMRNMNKTVIHIRRLRTNKYLFLFHIRWLLWKNFTDLQKFFEIKENFALAKNPK